MATAKNAKRKKTSSAKEETKKVSTPAVTKKNQLSLADIISDNKRSIIIGGIVIILAAAAFLLRGLFVAAIVNGQPVSRLSIIQELEKQSGQEALDKVITKMLVFQEGNKKKVSVTQEDIDKEIAKLSKQFKDQGQDLNKLLEAQGIKKEDFHDDIKIQIIVQKILGNEVNVSDKEFEDFLVKNPTLISAEKDQETAKKNLRLQLTQQKLSQKYQEWIAKIKKNAKILQFVNYGA